MKVSDLMTTNVELVGANESVLDAARTMVEQNIGFLPVAQGERLVGVLTDRDIVVRVTAEGLDPGATPVEQAMTPGTKYCFDDEDTDHVAGNMTDLNVCRLPVLNRARRLVGVISIEDIRPQRPLRLAGPGRSLAAELPPA